MDNLDDTLEDEPKKATAADDDTPEPDSEPGVKDAEPKAGNVFSQMMAWLKASPKHMMLAGAGVVVVVAIAVIGLTDLRYVVVGSVFKADVTLRVVDMTSTLPVPHAAVTLAGQTQFTDKT